MSDAVGLNKTRNLNQDWKQPKSELVAFVVAPVAPPPVAPIPVRPPVAAPSAPIVPGANFGNSQRAQEQRTLRTEFLLFGQLRDVPGQALREAAYGASIPSHYEQGIRRALSERGDALGTARNTYSDAERREISEGVARVVGEMMADGIGANSNAFGVGVRSAFDLAVAQIGARSRTESPGASPDRTRPTPPSAATPPAAATPGAPSAGPAASVPPTVTYTPPPPPQPTVFGNADLTLGGSTYKLSNTSDGFQVTNPAHDVAFSVPASSLAEARDMVKGAWLSGTLPGPTPSESPLTVAGKGFSIVGNNGTYGLRDPAGAMPFQLPGRTLGEAAEHAREAYFTGQIPGFTPQSNPLTIGGQRLDIVGSHGDFGVVLPNGGYAGRVRADSLPNAAAQMESLYLEGRLPGMTPQARSVELEQGRSVNVTGTGGDGPYGIVDESGALLARLRMPHSDGGTRNPQSFEEAAGAARAAFENGDLAPVGLAPVATTPPQNEEGIEPVGETPASSGPNGPDENEPVTGGGGEPPGVPPTNVVGMGGNDDEDDDDKSEREEEWEDIESEMRDLMGLRGIRKGRIDEKLAKFKDYFLKHSNADRDMILELAKNVSPDIISHALNNKWGVGLGALGTFGWLGFTNWQTISGLFDNNNSEVGEDSGDTLRAPWGFEVANPSNYAMREFDELLALDLTEPDNRQRANDAVMAWRSDKRKTAAESAFRNMDQTLLLNAGFDILRGINDFGNVALGGPSQIPSAFGELTAMAQWQGLQMAFNSVGAAIDGQAQHYLSRLDTHADIQQARKEATDGVLVTQVLRTAQGSIERADEALQPQGDLVTPADYRNAANRLTTHRGELLSVARQLQEISDERSDSLDPDSRTRLNDTIKTAQERVRALDGQVNTFHGLATTLHLALESDARAQRAEVRFERGEDRAIEAENRDVARRAISEGDAAIDRWNAGSTSAFKVEGLGSVSVQLPFNGVNIERFENFARENPVAGGVEGATGISHLSFLKALDARNPRWIDAVARQENEPLTDRERSIIKEEIFRRVGAADESAGRLIDIDVRQLERLLGPQTRSSAPIVPGMIAEPLRSQAAFA